MKSSTDSRTAFSVAEVANRNGISRELVRSQIAKGHLKAKKIGTRILILAEDERQWLESSGKAR